MLVTQRGLRQREKLSLSLSTSCRRISQSNNLAPLASKYQSLRRKNPRSAPFTSCSSRYGDSSSIRQEAETAAPLRDNNKAKGAGDSFVSLPGPSWLQTRVGRSLTYPFEAYGRAQNRRPYVVQILSSVVIYILGDLSSQYYFSGDAALAEDEKGDADNQSQRTFFRDDYSPARSVRAAIMGAMFAIPSYHWFLYLGSHFNVAGSHILSLGYKIIVNQILFNPVFNSYFFGMQSLLTFKNGWPSREELDARAKLTAAWIRIKETVPITFINAFKFWPVVTAFSFTFIPPAFRSVFAGCMAVIWQTYLGLVNLRAARKERELANEPELAAV